MDIEQILKSDMEREKHLIDFYMSYVKRIQDPEILELLKLTIADEKAHEELLNRAYTKLMKK
ncbi:MAG: hypothetical protein J7K68_05355 [Candidatus Diapherotrites archaeon]|nr:hypothetical protein [Candidatus Diapherotrites archaeon]